MKKHPGENQDEFIERAGLSIYKTKHKEIEVEVDEEVKEVKELCLRQANKLQLGCCYSKAVTYSFKRSF